MSSTVQVPTSQAEWRAALESLPSNPEKIPAFFFAHGSPTLVFPPEMAAQALGQARSALQRHMGPNGPLAGFLKDFGPALLRKYSPKAVVVFSAHWESEGETLVSDYGDENPLLMDYFGFPPQLYQLKFKSRGDTKLSEQIVGLFKKDGLPARTSPISEARGSDGRGFKGPGLDHGVFVPFSIMFGEELDVPVVQVTIDSSLKPEDEWRLGKIVKSLRDEKVLVLSGGLPIHNLRDFNSFSPDTAQPIHHSFHKAIIDALQVPDAADRKKALQALPKHAGFRACNPREEHFVPLYIAAGAAEDEDLRILNGMYGIPTVAFGV